MSDPNVDSSKELTHISLCAGYGGIDLGLQGAIRNLRTIAYSEIEAFACANLVAKMEAGSLDPAPIWTNLKTFPWEEFRGKVDIISGGFPCFEAGTLVFTRQLGYVPIETIRVGDLVLTHTGRWQPVTAVMRKDGADTIEIRPTVGLTTRCTTEHPYYARARTDVVERISADNATGQRAKSRKRRHLAEPAWVDAGDLEPAAHRIGIVFPTDAEHSDASADFWWLTGRYVADGWRHQQGTSGRVVIAANASKMEECVRRAAAAGLGGCVVQDRTCQKLHITRNKFYEWCSQFGDGAANKTVPGWVLGLQPELLRAFVDGYLAGDGHTEPTGAIAFTTVSDKLILGMALCVARVTGKPFNLRKQHRNTTAKIEGRTVNQRDWYRAIFANSQRRGVNNGSGVWSEFGRGPGAHDVTVYNIAVDGDESYVANGAVVHNCQPFSHAGKRKGDEDERHLFPAIKRGIEVCRPAFVFLENVEGILSAKLAGEDWADPAGTPVLLHVLRELERVGYVATAGIFSAAEVGAPHQRKRVFILAYDNRQRVEELRRQVAVEPGHDSSGNGGHVVYPSRPGEPQHGWEPPRVVGDSRKDVADSDGGGCEVVGQPESGGQQCSPGHVVDGCHRQESTMGGADHRGFALSLDTGSSSEEIGGEQGYAEPAEPRQAQPALGGDADGPTSRMDYAKLCVSCDNRTDELRLLGNGVVPATATKAFMVLSRRLLGVDS